MSLADDIALLSRNDDRGQDLQRELADMIARIYDMETRLVDMEVYVEQVRDGAASVTLGNYAHELATVGNGLRNMARECGMLSESLGRARKAGEEYIDKLQR